MKNRKIGRLMISAVFAGETCLLCDVLTVLFGKNMPILLFLLFFAGFTGIVFLLQRFRTKEIGAIVLLTAAIFSVMSAGSLALWKKLSNDAVYKSADQGKSELFAGRNVMIFVPHQDDDLNLLGGVIEEFTGYNSTVRVVFSTSGDYQGISETRMQEAVEYLSACGVPESNVIFLGYGNEWQNYANIYNAPEDREMTSYSGKTKTFGMLDHPAYHEGMPYTRANMRKDMEAVIEQYHPDVIFCSDYDDHIDHRILSLLFDEAIGCLLKKESDYSPLVLKGFAYYTSFLAYEDFYAENICSTKNPSGSVFPLYINVYQWKDRIRIPLEASSFSRSLYSSGLYQQMKYYSSQFLTERAERIINGDRVFWIRDTSSLLYHAEISATSGDAKLLHDFKLWDSTDLGDIRHFPFDGTWVPDQNDAEKTISVSFQNPENLTEVVLYDSPSIFDNVLSAELVFSSGKRYEVPALDIGGSPVSVPVDEHECTGFELRLLKSEGDNAGICEIEAYSERKEHHLAWIKFMNQSDDFVYDYQIDPSGEELFSLYSYGCSDNVEDYTIESTGCSTEIEEGYVKIICPAGAEGIVRIYDEETGVSDTIVVSNPKYFRNTVQKLEQLAFKIKETVSWTILKNVKQLMV